MKRILVVDDNVENAEVVLLLFEDAGYDLRTCLDATLFESLFEDFCPDLVLMDVMLGTCNGADICRALKSDPLRAATKVVLMSAGNRFTGTDGQPSLADAVLEKPFDLETMEKLVRKMLED